MNNPFHEEKMNNKFLESMSFETPEDAFNAGVMVTKDRVAMRVLRDIHDLVDGAVDIDSLEKLQDIINDIQGVIEWDYSMEDLGK